MTGRIYPFLRRPLLCGFLALGCIQTVIAQSTLDGFWGIPWGASLADSKVKMLSQKGITVDERLTNAGALTCKGGYFNGKPVTNYVLLFVEDKLCQAQVFLKPTPKTLVFEYRDWVADLTKKYGKPTNVWDSSPVEDGSPMLSDLVLAGKAQYATAWELAANDGSRCGAMAEITEVLLLRVFYENHGLMNKRVQMQKAKFGKDL